MKKTIHVLLSGDDNVAKYFPTIIVSVCENHAAYDCCFWCMHHRISQGSLKFMSETALKYGAVFHEVRVDNSIFAHSTFQDKWPVECFYYFVAHQYLPETVERAIYLDSDQCCFGDFSDYYFAEFNDNFILVSGGPGKEEKAKQIVDEETRCRATVYANNEYVVFCSGSLVLNLKKFRETNFSVDDMVKAQEARLKYIKPEDLFADQGLLNYLFYNKAGFFPARYQMAKWGITKETFEDIRIFHFMGRPKPWEELFEDEYINYSPNVFEDLPYWVQCCRKWWSYAKKCPNYEALLQSAKKRLYEKIENLYRSYVSQKCLANCLKKSGSLRTSQLVFDTPPTEGIQAIIPMADKIAWDSKKSAECRSFRKHSNIDYRYVNFPLRRYLEVGSCYEGVITAKASSDISIQLFLSGLPKNEIQYVFRLALSKDYREFRFQFRVVKPGLDYICFSSTGLPSGSEIMIKHLRIEAVSLEDDYHRTRQQYEKELSALKNELEAQKSTIEMLAHTISDIGGTQEAFSQFMRKAKKQIYRQ